MSTPTSGCPSWKPPARRSSSDRVPTRSKRIDPFAAALLDRLRLAGGRAVLGHLLRRRRRFTLGWRRRTLGGGRLFNRFGLGRRRGRRRAHLRRLLTGGGSVVGAQV